MEEPKAAWKNESESPARNGTELEAALAELRKQGLTVRLHSRENNTWHIADGGLYSGYAASGDELVELRRANNLSFCGIKSLG
jgi:hypothetical protein